jgi:hypothetical protein
MTLAIVALAPAYDPGSWSTFFTLTGVADGYRVMRGDGLPAYRRMLSSEDAREGVRAFTERRPPRWTGG